MIDKIDGHYALNSLELVCRSVIGRAVDAGTRYGAKNVKVAAARGLASMSLVLAYSALRNDKWILEADVTTLRKVIYVSCDLLDWAVVILANLTIDGLSVPELCEESHAEVYARDIVQESLPSLKAFLGPEHTKLAEPETVRFLAEFVALSEADGSQIGDNLLRAYVSTNSKTKVRS